MEKQIQPIAGFSYAPTIKSVVVYFDFDFPKFIKVSEIKDFVCGEGKDELTVPMPEGFEPIKMDFQHFLDYEFEIVGKEILEAILSKKELK